MKKIFLALVFSAMASSPALAKSASSYSMLNGWYSGEADPVYSFDGTRRLSIALGNVCQYSGTLTQSKSNKNEFLYKNTASDGVIEDCEPLQNLKILVVEKDSRTGIAKKIKVTSAKKYEYFTGTYELND